MNQWMSHFISISYTWSYVKLKTTLICASHDFQDFILSPLCRQVSRVSDSRSKFSCNKALQTQLFETIQICSRGSGGQKSKMCLTRMKSSHLQILFHLETIYSLPFPSSKGCCFWLLPASLILPLLSPHSLIVLPFAYRDPCDHTRPTQIISDSVLMAGSLISSPFQTPLDQITYSQNSGNSNINIFRELIQLWGPRAGSP